MTSHQRELLRFVERYQTENGGVSPSFGEMAAAMGLASKSGIHRLLEALERQGRVRRHRHQTRGIVILPDAAALENVPDAALLVEVARRGLLRAAA